MKQAVGLSCRLFILSVQKLLFCGFLRIFTFRIPMGLVYNDVSIEICYFSDFYIVHFYCHILLTFSLHYPAGTGQNLLFYDFKTTPDFFQAMTAFPTRITVYSHIVTTEKWLNVIQSCRISSIPFNLVRVSIFPHFLDDCFHIFSSFSRRIPAGWVVWLL